MTEKKILLIDPSGADSSWLSYFEAFNFSVEVKKVLPDSLQSLHKCNFLILERSQIPHPAWVRKIYTTINTPLIVIDDAFDEDACVQFLECGADDYLVKPINPRELHARLKVIARRLQSEMRQPEQEVWQFNDWSLYPYARRLLDAQQREVALSSGEFDLLMEFLRHPQQVLKREDLHFETSQEECSPFDRRVDVQVSRLRHKIECDISRPTLIKTIRNAGYMFTAKVRHTYTAV